MAGHWFLARLGELVGDGCVSVGDGGSQLGEALDERHNHVGIGIYDKNVETVVACNNACLDAIEGGGGAVEVGRVGHWFLALVVWLVCEYDTRTVVYTCKPFTELFYGRLVVRRPKRL